MIFVLDDPLSTVSMILSDFEKPQTALEISQLQVQSAMILTINSVGFNQFISGVHVMLGLFMGAFLWGEGLILQDFINSVPQLGFVHILQNV